MKVIKTAGFERVAKMTATELRQQQEMAAKRPDNNPVVPEGMAQQIGGAAPKAPPVLPPTQPNRPLQSVPQNTGRQDPASTQLNLLDRQVQQMIPMIRQLQANDVQLAQAATTNLQNLLSQLQTKMQQMTAQQAKQQPSSAIQQPQAAEQAQSSGAESPA